MNRRVVILTLAVGHGLNDLVAGFFLGRLAYLDTDVTAIGIALLLYNLLAFGGQYAVALWLEKNGNPKQLLRIAFGMNVIAIVLFTTASHLSIILAGIASALYHVAGGAVCAAKNRATDIGLFAAPGVAGLIAGGYWAFNGAVIILPLLLAAGLFFAAMFLLPVNQNSPGKQVPDVKFSIDRHDLVMIALLTVISLRSVIWNVFQLIHENNYEWLLAIAGAAVAGKVIGGWLADRIGWRLYAISSLIVATPLLNFFRNELLLFCIGIGLLQSGIPATTALLVRSMTGRPARAIGLSFGTAIIIGALLFYSPLHGFILSAAGTWVISLLMLLLLVKINPMGTFSTRAGRA